MIRLAIAVGFLAVFGVVAYAIVLLLTNYFKNNMGDALTTDTTTDLSSGKFDVIRDARWHRLQMEFTGDWEMAGFSPEWEGSGLE